MLIRNTFCQILTTNVFLICKFQFDSDSAPRSFFKWAIPGLFLFIFVSSIQLTVYVRYKFLPMTGFEQRTSGIGRDRSTN